MFVSIAIALAVAGKYFILGVLLALWSLYSVLVLPVAKKISYLLTGSELRGHRAQALTVVGLRWRDRDGGHSLVPGALVDPD